MTSPNGFVPDGCSRGQSAAEPEIRQQVLAEFVEQLSSANVWQRIWLRRSIERDVQFRLNKLAPPEALY